MWDIWFYRENIGWWLEEKSVRTADVARTVRAFLRDPDHSPGETKYAWMMVPPGMSPPPRGAFVR